MKLSAKDDDLSCPAESAAAVGVRLSFESTDQGRHVGGQHPWVPLHKQPLWPVHTTASHLRSGWLDDRLHWQGLCWKTAPCDDCGSWYWLLRCRGGGAMEGYMVALLLAPAPWTRQWSWLLVMGWRRISKWQLIRRIEVILRVAGLRCAPLLTHHGRRPSSYIDNSLIVPHSQLPSFQTGRGWPHYVSDTGLCHGCQPATGAPHGSQQPLGSAGDDGPKRPGLLAPHGGRGHANEEEGNELQDHQCLPVKAAKQRRRWLMWGRGGIGRLSNRGEKSDMNNIYQFGGIWQLSLKWLFNLTGKKCCLPSE